MRPGRPLTRLLPLAAVACVATITAAACSVGQAAVRGPGERAMAATSSAPSPAPAAAASLDPAIDPDIGINNITHVIVIVQENRSFDHYFGTFPGADGYSRDARGRIDVCVPDPAAHVCRRPYHDTNLFDAGGPHGLTGSAISEDGGRMDGFVKALEQIGNGCAHHPDDFACRRARRGPAGQPDIMGYHTGKEIPNYWAYAKHFVLQDHMFAPESSWTLPSHLYLVSGWAATCPDLGDAMSCRSDLEFPGGNAAEDGRKMWIPVDGTPRPYIWADVTWLLHKHHVSWAYYVGSGDVPEARLRPVSRSRGHGTRAEHVARIQDGRGRSPARRTSSRTRTTSRRRRPARFPRSRGSCRRRTEASTRRTTSATAKRG